MSDLVGALAELTGDFSGVISISERDGVVSEHAYGLADRAHGLPCTPQIRFGIASGGKGFTALVVVGLIADGALSTATTARSVLGADLPLIADDVTVEHLLTHTSGIGDYLDEETGELPLKVPVYELVDTEDYLPALDGIPTKFAAGARFGYCNSGYVVLALIAERVSGQRYHALVQDRVVAPAGMTRTEFLRSDLLPGDAALGYLPDGRTNVFSLPVRGNGDGGVYTTVADIRQFWQALFAGRILRADWVEQMTTPHSGPEDRMYYGYGFWLDGSTVVLSGGDHGVSFMSAFDPAPQRCYTVVSNTEHAIRAIVERMRGIVPGNS
jgi:CubicO group peptidase (beta-lactamase class C family)